MTCDNVASWAPFAQGMIGFLAIAAVIIGGPLLVIWVAHRIAESR